MSSSPGDAEIVVIGGGAVGTGAAYSLAKAGKKDLLLIEREDSLARVTTSQGAGLAGQVRSSVERTQLMKHSIATFTELSRDPVAPLEWHPVGSLRVAETSERVEEFGRLAKVAAAADLEVQWIGREAAERHWPALDFSTAKAILWCPTDGYMIPLSVVNAYEHQCRQMGVRFATSTALKSIVVRDGRVEGLETSLGKIRCKYVVNAAGAHAYHVAKLAGLELPIVPVRHEYFVSVPMAGLHPDLPCLRLPDATLYGRASNDSLLLGGWEPVSLRADPRSYALEAGAPPIEPDWKVLRSFQERFSPFLPRVRGVESQRVGKGWPTFTPDGRFIVGESSRVKGFVMAGGCNAHGISGSAGIGRLLVESLLEKSPSRFVRSLSPDRFNETTWDWEAASKKAQKVYESYYAIEAC